MPTLRARKFWLLPFLLVAAVGLAQESFLQLPAALPNGTELVVTDRGGDALLGYGRIEEGALRLRLAEAGEVLMTVIGPDGSFRSMRGRVDAGGRVHVGVGPGERPFELVLQDAGVRLTVERVSDVQTAEDEARPAEGGQERVGGASEPPAAGGGRPAASEGPGDDEERAAREVPSGGGNDAPDEGPPEDAPAGPPDEAPAGPPDDGPPGPPDDAPSGPPDDVPAGPPDDQGDDEEGDPAADEAGGSSEDEGDDAAPGGGPPEGTPGGGPPEGAPGGGPSEDAPGRSG